MMNGVRERPEHLAAIGESERGMILADLHCFESQIGPQAPLSDVVLALEEQPELPGVIVADEDKLLGILARQPVREELSRPFGQELYLRRPVTSLMHSVNTKVTILPEDCGVHEAAQVALTRPMDHVYEPIVVTGGGRQPRLLDVHELLMVQSRLLTEANETIRQQKQSAEAANLAKSRFLANMSHEIRTPLTAILGFTENLLDPDLTETEQRKNVRIVMRNGEHLLQIINDILDLSKIEAGKLEVERIDVDIVPLLADVASAIRVRAGVKGLTVAVRFDGAIPAIISTDPTRLRQILINLLGNAVKFTESGEVVLRVGLFEPENESACLQFHVVDTGIGMTEQQAARLFQPFTQADETMTRRFGGTGLGLSISRRLCRMLGGEIGVSSKLGKGSTFRFTINPGELSNRKILDDPNEALQRAEQADIDQPVDEIQIGGRVLVADDGADNRLLISSMLRKWGAEVGLVEHGAAAVEEALRTERRGKPYDVILMDMQMPILNGYEAVRKLRDMGYTRPIVALTANAMGSDRIACLQAGCDDYAIKPIDRRRLAGQISRYIDSEVTPTAAVDASRSMADDSVSGQDSATSPAPGDVFDERVAIQRAAGDRSIAAEVAGIFLDLQRKWIAELQSAFEANDRRTMIRLAHTVKSSADNIGGSKLYNIAQSLEHSPEDHPLEEVRELVERTEQAALELAEAVGHFADTGGHTPAPIVPLPENQEADRTPSPRRGFARRRHNKKQSRNFKRSK